jgi:hypothetical protein
VVLDLRNKLIATKHISFHTEPIDFRMLFKNIKPCSTIILRVLFRCGNWSVTVRGENRLRAFERPERYLDVKTRERQVVRAKCRLSCCLLVVL